jgi:uncharacterized phage-associated protein
MNIKKYDSVTMAKHLIFECFNRGYDANNTKMNKLLYALYGIYLAKYNETILTESPKYFPY